jgi:hypothetical protein
MEGPAMSAYYYRDGVLREHYDDEAREYRTYSPTGGLTSTRPYTPDEVARVEAGLPVDGGAGQAQATIEDALSTALTELQTLIATDNAVLRDNPAPALKIIARALRRIIRILLRRFDGTD